MELLQCALSPTPQATEKEVRMYSKSLNSQDEFRTICEQFPSMFVTMRNCHSRDGKRTREVLLLSNEEILEMGFNEVKQRKECSVEDGTEIRVTLYGDNRFLDHFRNWTKSTGILKVDDVGLDISLHSTGINDIKFPPYVMTLVRNPLPSSSSIPSKPFMQCDHESNKHELV
jgi:hypothetical protein